MFKFLLKTGAKTCSIPWNVINRFDVMPYYYMNELPFFNQLKKELHNNWKTNLIYFGPPAYKNPVSHAANYLENLAKTSDQTNENELVIVYIDTLDGVGHKYGTKSSEWKNTLLNVDDGLKLLYSTLNKQLPAFHFQVFSDHGMAEIDHTIDILAYLRKNGVNLRDDVVVFVDATIAMIWFEKLSCKSSVLKALEKLGSDKVILFDRESDAEALEKYGVSLNAKEYGDLIIQTMPGYMFFPNYYSEITPFRATHGYLPGEEHQLSFLLNVSKNCNRVEFKPSHIKDLKQYLLANLGSTNGFYPVHDHK